MEAEYFRCQSCNKIKKARLRNEVICEHGPLRHPKSRNPGSCRKEILLICTNCKEHADIG